MFCFSAQFSAGGTQSPKPRTTSQLDRWGIVSIVDSAKTDHQLHHWIRRKVAAPYCFWKSVAFLCSTIFRPREWYRRRAIRVLGRMQLCPLSYASVFPFRRRVGGTWKADVLGLERD
jgi:hypothetical protein